MLRTPADAVFRRTVEPCAADPPTVPAMPNDADSVQGGQMAILARLMFGAEVARRADLPARTLRDRMALAAFTLRNIHRAEAGSPICAISGPYFPDRYGRFDAVVTRSKLRALWRTLAGLGGVALSPDTPPVAPSASLWGLGIDRAASLCGSFTRNSLFQIFARRAGEDVVIHVGTTDSARRSLVRHYRGLKSAAQWMRGRQRIDVPTVVDFGDVGEIGILVQNVLAGDCFEPRKHTVEALRRHLDAAFVMLREMHGYGSTSAQAPEAAFVRADCERMLSLLPQVEGKYLVGLIASLRSWQERTRVGSTLCHGDMWFPNILFRDDGFGLIDWEWARPDGVPGYDALHLLALSLADFYRLPLGRAFAAIADPGRMPSWVPAAIAEIARSYGLSAEDVMAISRLLLLVRIWQGYILTYSGGATWLRELVLAYRAEAA